MQSVRGGFASYVTPEQRTFLLTELIDKTPAGLCILDQEMRYLYINAPLAEINGLPLEAHLGRTVPEVLPDFYQYAKDKILAAMSSDTPTPNMATHGIVPANPDEVREWRGDWYPIEVPGLGRVMAVTCHDVTEERRLARALESSNQELTLSSRRKDVLLATLAHEMRNPLAPLANVVPLLKAARDPLCGRVADIVQRQTAQLQRLADDLMDASQIRTGKMAFTFAPVLLRDVVQAAIDNTLPRLNAKGQHLQFLKSSPEAMVRADATRLVQLFSNLVGNASKYSASGADVTVTLTAETPNDVFVRVRDHGQGIEASRLDSIFGLFEQGIPEVGAQSNGLGLGLWLARQNAVAHGGDILVASQGRGLGSTFTVKLPLHNERAPPMTPDVPDAPEGPMLAA